MHCTPSLRSAFGPTTNNPGCARNLHHAKGRRANAHARLKSLAAAISPQVLRFYSCLSPSDTHHNSNRTDRTYDRVQYHTHITPIHLTKRGLADSKTTSSHHLQPKTMYTPLPLCRFSSTQKTKTKRYKTKHTGREAYAGTAEQEVMRRSAFPRSTRRGRLETCLCSLQNHPPFPSPIVPSPPGITC